jgi:hypothetical protein
MIPIDHCYRGYANAPRFYVIPKLPVVLYTVYVFEVLYVMMMFENSGTQLGSWYTIGWRGMECGRTSSMPFASISL